MKKALLSDSIATVAGAALGTSTVTTYVESSAGIAEGGKTGLTSLTVAVLFLIAMFFTPLAALIPSAATSAALIYVGVLMISALSELDFYDPVVIAPAFVTLIGMPLTYSISDGIGLGIITYLVIMLITGKIKQINWITYIIAALFILKFFVL
jgi:AGZA family xanthine/uracil permease-like MFS transporter